MGQTILSFHQHFVERLENTMQIRKKYYIKDNMDLFKTFFFIKNWQI